MPQYFSFNPTQPNPWMDPTHVHLCDEPFIPVVSRRAKRQRQHSSPAAATTNTRLRSSPLAAAQRQGMPQRRAFMYGKSSAVGAKVAAAQAIPRKAIFCLDSLRRSCSVDDIKSFVSSLSVEVLSCFEVKPRRRRGESEDDVRRFVSPLTQVSVSAC